MTTGGSGPICEPTAPTAGHCVDAFDFNTATALILGTDGAPAGAITTKVCGCDQSGLPMATDAQGNAGVSGPSTDAVDLSFVYGTGKTHAEFVVPLDPATNDIDFGTIHAITLAPFAQGAAIAPGTDVSHGGVTLSIPADASLDHDNLLYPQATERVFRTNTVLDADFNFPAVDDSGLDIEVLVALAPHNTIVCPKAALTVPNLAGWAPAAGVDFYVHGILTFNHYAPYGGWEKVAEGTVSADGVTITTRDGEGIELLSIYGLVLQ
jgi:hypothetical protein